MVVIEGGAFKQGCQKDDTYCDNDESPAHTVMVQKFAISRFEVTREQWKEVMGSDPSEAGKGKRLPVDNVSWNDAQEFVRKLNAASGEQYRLPTESEWEYAARGGNQSNGFHFAGSESMFVVGHYFPAENDGTEPVGSFKENELGLYDMSGNVFEWCSDWYDERRYNKLATGAMVGAAPVKYRVLRGGSWASPRYNCRVTDRGGDEPNAKRDIYGLRLAMTVK